MSLEYVAEKEDQEGRWFFVASKRTKPVPIPQMKAKLFFFYCKHFLSPDNGTAFRPD
jgi:hypothetical protein